jgi:hypothetical protein
MQGFRVIKVPDEVRDAYSACACPTIDAADASAPDPVETEVQPDIRGAGKGGDYCADAEVAGFDTENTKSVLYYCKDDLEAVAASKKETPLVPIICGAVGALFAAVAMVMMYNRQQKGKRHQIGNVPGTRRVVGARPKKKKGSGPSFNKMDSPMGPPPRATISSGSGDPVSREYGLGPPPAAKKSVKNPIMTDNLDRHDSF